jgi:hypothetical protein
MRFVLPTTTFRRDDPFRAATKSLPQAVLPWIQRPAAKVDSSAILYLR